MNKRNFAVLTLMSTLLIAGCSLQLAPVPHTPKAVSVKAQILDFYQDANQLAEHIQDSSNGRAAAAAKQSLEALPEGLRNRLLEIRAEAFKLHPEVQQQNIWLSEKIQLVQENEKSNITDTVYGLFTLSVPTSTGETGWLAQLVLDMETDTVVDYVINPDLSKVFVPAFTLVVPNLNEPPLIRKVWTGKIEKSSLSGEINTETIELDDNGNVLRTLQ